MDQYSSKKNKIQMYAHLNFWISVWMEIDRHMRK